MRDFLLRRTSTLLGCAIGLAAVWLILWLPSGPSLPSEAAGPAQTPPPPAAETSDTPGPTWPTAWLDRAPPAPAPRGWQGFIPDVPALLELVERGRPDLITGLAQPLRAAGNALRFGPAPGARNQPPLRGSIPGRFEQPAVIDWSGHRLAIEPLFGEGPAEVKGDAVVYRLRPGLDVVRVALPERLEELLVLTSPQDTTFRYRLSPDASVDGFRHTGIGSVELLSSGTPFLRLNPVEALDAGRNLISGAWQIQPQTDGSLLASLSIDLSHAQYPVAIDPGWSATATLNQGRHSHSLARLQDGQILVIGGYGYSGTTLVELYSAERFDPVSNTWSATANLIQHYGHVNGSATVLQDGRVLAVQGGASLYDPASDLFTATSTPQVIGRRAHHAAALLPSGRVLVCGGEPILTSVYEPSDRAELYDPADDTWQELPPMQTRRSEHSATALADGRVFIAGGQTDNFGGETETTELYQEGMGFQAGPDLPDAADSTSRWGHTATRLQDGRVLLTGGRSNTYQTGSLFRGFVFDPTTSSYTTARSLASKRYAHTAVLLDNGQVLLVGGDTYNGSRTAQCELYDPLAHQFIASDNLPAGRMDHVAVSLGGNGVFVAGGSSSFDIEASCLSWDVVLPPPPPTALVQRDGAGQQIPEAGSLEGDLLTVEGLVERPGGGLVWLEVELRSHPDPSAYSLTLSSPQLDGAGLAQVSFAGLLPGSYAWTARSRSDQGLASVDVTPHAAASFTIDAPLLPAAISGLMQLDQPSGIALPVGSIASGSSLRFEAQVGHQDDLLGDVAIELELKPVAVAFDGQGTVLSSSIPAPAPPTLIGQSLTLVDLPDGDYHWRARAISSNHQPSGWLAFGGNLESEPDVTLATSVAGYATDFELENVAGWSFSPAQNGVAWDTDSSPSGVAGGAFQSPSRSLNYNNGSDYANGAANQGTAKSPAISLAGLNAPVLEFLCNYHTETTGPTWDRRSVQILDADTGAELRAWQLYKASGLCDDAGIWHLHRLDLEPGWGTVTVAFDFDTIDSVWNNFPGWFVDDLRVGEDPTPPPPPPGQGCYSSGFEAGVGWSFENTAADVGWAVDASGALLPAGPARSGLSLNYNDGSDYDNGQTNGGKATSPSIDLSGCAAPVLRFWCQYQTEGEGTTWDQRWLRVFGDASGETEFQLSGVFGCEPGMGVWHLHEHPLDSADGSVQIQFEFQTLDPVYNGFGGWAIDDLSVGD